MTISAFTFRFAVPGALDCSIIEDNCEFCIPLEVCHTPLHNIIIAQHYNATQSGKVSPTNANWNLIAFQWKLMLQKMFATWRPQRNNLLQFIFSPTFLTNEVNVFFQLQFFLPFMTESCHTTTDDDDVNDSFISCCTSPLQILTRALKWMSRLPTWTNRKGRTKEIGDNPDRHLFPAGSQLTTKWFAIHHRSMIFFHFMTRARNGLF